jgi:hypothetical protein
MRGTCRPLSQNGRTLNHSWATKYSSPHLSVYTLSLFFQSALNSPSLTDYFISGRKFRVKKWRNLFFVIFFHVKISISSTKKLISSSYNPRTSAFSNLWFFDF